MPTVESLTPSDFVWPVSVDGEQDQLKKVTFPGGFSLCTFAPDEASLIYNEIMIKQEYFRNGLAIEGARCVIDVGGNIGVFTVAAKLRAPEAAIYTFEAIPDTFEVLKQNVVMHNPDGVHLFNLAVGAQDQTERAFTYFPHMPGNSTANPALKETNRPVMDEIFGAEASAFLHQAVTRTVPVRTLSAIIREERMTCIDYLKIDVEGDELVVLAGIEPDHWPLIQQVAIETHSEALRQQVCEILSAHGFDVFSDLGISSPIGVSDVYAKRI